MRCKPWSGLATLGMCLVLLGGAAGQKRATTVSPGRDAPEAQPMFRDCDEQQRFRGGYLWLLDRDRTNVQSLSFQHKTVLKQLDSGKVRTPEEAAKVTTGDKLRLGGLLATERPIVVSLIRVAVDCSGFASQGDLVWIVHIEQLGGGVSQEAWINARNGAVRWMPPLEKGMVEGE